MKKKMMYFNSDPSWVLGAALAVVTSLFIYYTLSNKDTVKKLQDYYLGLIEKQNKDHTELIQQYDKLSTIADSMAVASEQTLKHALKIEKENSELKFSNLKYKFENNNLKADNEKLTFYSDGRRQLVDSLVEDINKSKFVIEELKSEKDSLIQQLNNYKLQTDAVNQLIKDKKVILGKTTPSFNSKTGKISMKNVKSRKHV